MHQNMTTKIIETSLQPINTNYRTSNFEVESSFTDSELANDWNLIGLNISLHRTLKPFVMEYYLPCAGVVFIAQLSFIIPLSEIAGRVGLLVTLLLSLINIFNNQTVSNFIMHLMNIFYVLYTVILIQEN